MAGENYTNTASTATTTAPVGPSDVTATLTSFSGFPAQPFWGEFDKDTASAEIVRVTNVAGSVITMTRGQGGTSATSHGAGVTFNLVAPADFFNRTETHMSDTTDVHGATGSVVGTTGSQTVSDKLFRGAAKSQHSDALPAGITASFESVADNTSARDGFVHRNTAGSASRSAFLAQQSGVDRFKVSNTGNVTVTPSTGTGLTVSGGESLAGGLTVTSGGINVTGGVVASGGAIITGSTDLGATTADSLSSDTIIHAGGAIDTDSNLTVDGTSTLTGAVSTGAGLTVGTTASVGTSATVGTTLAVTQGITAWGSRVPMSVASTAAVTTPVTGDVIWDRSAKLWKEWTGSAWAAFAVPYAQLRQTALQNVPNATFTPILFNTEDFDNVGGHSTSSNTSRYTCVAGFEGVYEFGGQASFGTGGTGSRTTLWTKNGVVLPASQGPGYDPGDTGFALARPIMVRLVAGDYVELNGYQSNGATLATSIVGEFQSSMTVKWIAP